MNHLIDLSFPLHCLVFYLVSLLYRIFPKPDKQDSIVDAWDFEHWLAPGTTGVFTV